MAPQRMTKCLKRPRDLVQLGKLIGDILTGQVEDKASIQASKGLGARVARGLERRPGLALDQIAVSTLWM